MEYGDYAALLQGAVITIGLSLAAIVLGMPLGLLLALARWQRVPILNPIVAAYVSLMRAAPAVTLGLLLYFSLPEIGVSLDPVPAGIITLTLSTSAFNCEIWRGALLAFPKDQIEAAMSVGMRASLRFRRIVLPQVARAAMPALVSEMTMLVKVSPAIAVLGVVDITRAAVRIGAQTYDPLPPFAAALVLYSALVAILVVAQRAVERRLLRSATPAASPA